MPTGFKDNMSKFLWTVSEEEANHLENVIKHDGKPHRETFNLYDKFLQKPDELPIVYTQFVQRYKAGIDPQCENYSLSKEFYDYTTESSFNMDQNQIEKEKKIKVGSRLLKESDKKKLQSRTTALKNILDHDLIFEYE